MNTNIQHFIKTKTYGLIELIAPEEYAFGSKQQENLAADMNATAILYWPSDCRGHLPKYILSQLEKLGYKTVKKIGYTTYDSNTFGLSTH